MALECNPPKTLGDSIEPETKIDLLDLLARIYRFLEGWKESEQPIVLVIEDDPDFQQDLSLELAESGFYVFTANDGYEGVELAKATRLAAVISDICMPRKNGVTVLRELRAMDKELPVFIVTGAMPGDPVTDPDGKLKSECESLGVSGYFRKPVSMEALAVAVKLAIGPNQQATQSVPGV